MIKKTTFDTKVVVLHPHSQKKYRSNLLFGSQAIHLGPLALRPCIAAGLPFTEKSMLVIFKCFPPENSSRNAKTTKLFCN